MSFEAERRAETTAAAAWRSVGPGSWSRRKRGGCKPAWRRSRAAAVAASRRRGGRRRGSWTTVGGGNRRLSADIATATSRAQKAAFDRRRSFSRSPAAVGDRIANVVRGLP